MSSRRFNTNRIRSRNPGVFGPHCIFLPSSKVGAFNTLFAAIQKDKGSETKALEFVGMSNGALYIMREGRLSEMIAKRIMAAYKKLKKPKA